MSSKIAYQEPEYQYRSSGVAGDDQFVGPEMIRVGGRKKNRRDTIIRRCLWLYLILLIFEGALRKWFLPGLENPLLVVRDPVCIVALFYGYPYLRKLRWPWAFASVGVIAIPLAVAFGHGSFLVALFGARVLLLHFPLIFLFPVVFDRDDVWRVAKFMLIVAIPMVVLLAAQFYLPATHVLNVGTGGRGTSTFSGAAGRFRCSGTFSFTNGLVSFFTATGALLAAYLVRGPKPLPKWIWMSVVAVILALPLSISRALAFQYGLIVLFTAFAAGLSPKLLRRVVPSALALGVLIIVVAQFPVYDSAMEAFSARWESATRSEGGGDGVSGVVQNRIGDYMFMSAFRSVDETPLLGYGIGMGTNTGSEILIGKREFLIAEGGLGAMIGELGPFLGLALIFLRAALVVSMGAAALVSLRSGNPVPLILGGVAFQAMLLGNTGQPTALGFLVLICGLLLAATKLPATKEYAVETNQYELR